MEGAGLTGDIAELLEVRLYTQSMDMWKTCKGRLDSPLTCLISAFFDILFFFCFFHLESVS